MKKPIVQPMDRFTALVVLLDSVHSSQSGDISHWVLARLASLLPEYPRKLLNFPNGLNRHPSYVITSLEQGLAGLLTELGAEEEVSELVALAEHPGQPLPGQQAGLGGAVQVPLLQRAGRAQRLGVRQEEHSLQQDGGYRQGELEHKYRDIQ